MVLNLAQPVARHDKPATVQSRLWGRGRRLITEQLAAVALAAVASLTVIPAGSAYAYDHEIVEIQSVGNGALRADVIWASTADFQGVFLWTDNSSTSQEFELLESPGAGGYFRIKARHSGKCLMLDWRGGTYTDGTRIIQYPACDAGYAPAEWSIVYVNIDNGYGFGPTYQTLKNRYTGRCLDAANSAGGVPGQQAVLQQWDCISTGHEWNVWNQMWRLVEPTHP